MFFCKPEGFNNNTTVRFNPLKVRNDWFLMADLYVTLTLLL